MSEISAEFKAFKRKHESCDVKLATLSADVERLVTLHAPCDDLILSLREEIAASKVGAGNMTQEIEDLRRQRKSKHLAL